MLGFYPILFLAKDWVMGYHKHGHYKFVVGLIDVSFFGVCVLERTVFHNSPNVFYTNALLYHNRPFDERRLRHYQESQNLEGGVNGCQSRYF